MKPKLLIAGGSHADIPVIEAAKKLGFHVVTSGNNPADLGHRYSDEQHYEDYSDPEAILRLARKLRVDALCASSNDFSALSCAYAAEKLGLAGHDAYETARIIHHKHRFRQFAQKHGLPVPRAAVLPAGDGVFPELLEDLDFPLMVKPVDLSGGKGMRRVESTQELVDAVENARRLSRQREIVVEEFIEGSNHGYSALLDNGKIIFAFMDDEHYFLNPYLVSGASSSLSDTPALRTKLDAALERLASLLNLTDGLLHVQFILRDNEPYLLEICRRTPGDLYLMLIEYATGFPMAEAIVNSVVGQSLPPYLPRTKRWISRHCVMAERTGSISRIDYGVFEKKIFDRLRFYARGEQIEEIMAYKAEIDFIEYNNEEEMRKLRSKLTDEIKIRYMA